MSKEQQYSLGIISPPSSVTFMMNNNDEAMRITKEGVWVNPNIPVDAAANAVIGVLDQHIKALVKRQPLSNEAINNIFDTLMSTGHEKSIYDLVHEIEKAHGITNEP